MYSKSNYKTNSIWATADIAISIFTHISMLCVLAVMYLLKEPITQSEYLLVPPGGTFCDTAQGGLISYLLFICLVVYLVIQAMTDTIKVIIKRGGDNNYTMKNERW